MSKDYSLISSPMPTETERRRSTLSVPKMDCPSEENLIRMALAPVEGILAIKFDLAGKTVTVDHVNDAQAVLDALLPLKLGAQLHSSAPWEESGDTGFISVLAIPKMDCPSEENIIRMALSDLGAIRTLEFDLARQTLKVAHQGAADAIVDRLAPLGLGAKLISSESADPDKLRRPEPNDDAGESRTLRWLLAINGLMFFVEIIWGMLAQSTGLIADSLDMFADAAVYILALYAVGRSAQLKKHAAHAAGWLQLVLALGALGEVLRRGITGSEPESVAMMGIGAVALVANVACLVLIAKKRHLGAHMKASYIFSANDVIANLGVIVAGALVTWTGSRYPDLVVGVIIGVIVLNGARRILRLN